MKFPRHKATILSAAMLVAGVNSAICANTYVPYVVGYVNVTYSSGSNLISNPLQTSTNNFLSEIFTNQPTQQIPDGVSVSLWDSTNLSFYLASVYTNATWTPDISMPPGTGALLVTPIAFTNTVVGAILDHGGDLDPGLTFPPPPVYTGPNGLFLLGDKAPITDVGTNIFVNILGRPPFPGEQVITLSGTNTYFGDSGWDTVPVLYPGQSVFLNVTTIPSPVLTIVDVGTQVIVSWPASYSTNWILQTNGDLILGAWATYQGPIVNNAVTNSPVYGQLYYRLIY